MIPLGFFFVFAQKGLEKLSISFFKSTEISPSSLGMDWMLP